METENVTLTGIDDPELVSIVFLSDGLAREGNESFSLRLTPFPSVIQIMPSGPGVFFKNNLEVTIIDVDGKL